MGKLLRSHARIKPLLIKQAFYVTGIILITGAFFVPALSTKASLSRTSQTVTATKSPFLAIPQAKLQPIL